MGAHHMASPNALEDLLSKMEKQVSLKVFTSEDQCVACSEVLGIVQELETASGGKITWEHVSIDTDKEGAARWDVSRAPTILFPDFGITYTGAPIGLETAPFIQTIIMASTGQTMVFQDRRALDRVKKAATLRVIVTPTCPYCAQAVLLENSLAILSDKIRVEVVESYENPDIARKYNVTGVPVTIINDKIKIDGVPNLATLLSHLVDDQSKASEIYG